MCKDCHKITVIYRNQRCRECHNARKRLWWAKHRNRLSAERTKTYNEPENRKRHLDQKRAYYQKHREAIRARAKLRRLTKPNALENERSYRLNYHYGLTPEDYRIMINQQAGKCAICRRISKLSVDHNHVTRKVRGLLCAHCNHLLGNAREDQFILHSAINYLQSHSQAYRRVA